MNSAENAMSPPLSSSPPVRKAGTSGRRPCRPRTTRPQPDRNLQHRDRGISVEELNCEPLTVVCEVFKYELPLRAQARRFLWEFFD